MRFLRVRKKSWVRKYMMDRIFFQDFFCFWLDKLGFRVYFI